MRSILILAIAALLMVSAGAVLADPTPNGWGHDNTISSSASGTYTASNFVYDPGTYSWEQGVDDPVDGGGFTVKCDIEMWLNMKFNAKDIYFHIGRDPGANPTLQQDVTGWLSSNNGQWLFVSKPTFKPLTDDITKLTFDHNIFGGASPGPTPPVAAISVEWWLADLGASRKGTYSTGGNNGNLYGVTWLLDNGATGTHNFTITCKIKPDQYQPDGQYTMDPVLVASPEV